MKVILLMVLTALSLEAAKGDSVADNRRYHALKFGNSLPDHIVYQPNMTALQTAFSVCSWLRKIRSGYNPCWLSYAISSTGNEILISDDGDYNFIFDGNQDLSSNFSVTPGTWYHYCSTWSLSSGTRRVYVNGQQIGTYNTPAGRSLGMNGYLMIGNDQDDLGTGDDPDQVFGGELYKLNFFSKELSSSEVQAMAREKCSGVEETYGDVRSIRWEDIIQKERNGNVTEIETECTAPDTSVDCEGDKITLHLAESETFEKVHLLEKGRGCEFTGVEAREIQIGVHECGTIVQFNETHVIYGNKVRAYKSHGGNGLITRTNILTLDFQCIYNRTGTTDHISWEIPGLTVAERVHGSGHLTFLLEMFETDEFSSKIPSSDYPVDMELQDMVYLEVQVDSTDPNLSLGVVHLEAKDTPDRSSGTSYYLIQNGCTKDSTLKQITTDKTSGQAVDPRHKRFAFETFNFLHNQTAVFVHAVVKVCGRDDDSCNNLCEDGGSNRKRRSVIDQEEYHLYQGPLIRSTDDQSDAFGLSGVEDGTEIKFTVLTVAVFLSLIL